MERTCSSVPDGRIADPNHRSAVAALSDATRLLRLAWSMSDVSAVQQEAARMAEGPGEMFGVFAALAALLSQLQQHQATGKRWGDLLEAAQVPIDGRRPDEHHVADTIARVLREQRVPANAVVWRIEASYRGDRYRVNHVATVLAVSLDAACAEARRSLADRAEVEIHAAHRIASAPVLIAQGGPP